MSVIGKVTLPNSTNNLIASTCYGTCDTASATVAKVATIQDSQAFTLMTGITVYIKFTEANTADAPTLNVNGTGAKAIKKYGTTAIGKTVSTSWGAGAVVSFTYDGTYWQHNDHIDNTNTNTWRNITVDGTAWKSTGTSTGAVNFKSGYGVTYVTSGNDLSVGLNGEPWGFTVSDLAFGNWSITQCHGFIYGGCINLFIAGTTLATSAYGLGGIYKLANVDGYIYKGLPAIAGPSDVVSLTGYYMPTSSIHAPIFGYLLNTEGNQGGYLEIYNGGYAGVANKDFILCGSYACWTEG